MPEPWDRRIRRAEQLAAGDGSASALLAFYARLLRAQKKIYDGLNQGQSPSGSLVQDLALLRRSASSLLKEVAEHGPPELALDARSLIASGDSTLDEVLSEYWRAPSDRQFFAKAVLQPYGQWLADSGIRPAGRAPAVAENRCPRCGGSAQLSILESSGAISGDGSSRALLCATCLTSWPFRRVCCPSCGEGDERKLGYFQSPAFEYQRVEACETCRRYLKTIDLGRLGLAVPLVDEVAGAPLDLWAHEHGYQKIELNLVGL